MHELRKIGYIWASSDLSSWNITNQSFNPRIWRNNLTKSCFDNMRDSLSRNRLILPLEIKSIEFGIRNYRSRVKLDFIWLKPRICINIPKGLNIHLRIWSIEPWHNMNRNLKSKLSHTMECFSYFLNMMPSLIEVKNSVVCRLHSHFYSSYPHFSSLFTILPSHKKRRRLNRKSDDPIFSGFIESYSFWQRIWKLNFIFIQNFKSIFPFWSSNRTFYLQLRETITRIIEFLYKVNFVISWIEIPGSTQDNHLNFISFMPSLFERV